MPIAYGLIGGLIILIVMIDVTATVLGKGGGLITKWLTGIMWAFALRLHRERHHRLLSWAGMTITAAVVVAWAFLLWIGWSLVFASGHTAVVDADTHLPADFWHRVYFLGTTIFTLGTGDYLGDGVFWKIMMTLAGFTGLSIITLSITYLTPVVQASTQKRELAVQIQCLGSTPAGVILAAWDGEGCESLGQHLTSLMADVATLQQHHLAYPVLHYLHSVHPEEAASVRLAALDEALSILEYAFDDPCAPPQLTHPVRHVITRLLDTLDGAFIEQTDDPPPPPSLEPLRQAGLPVVAQVEFERRLRAATDRRRLLAGLVQSDGWAWACVERHEETGA